MAHRSQHAVLDYPAMSELRRQYDFRYPPAVENCLADHAAVMSLLTKAASELRTLFPPDITLVLDASPDYEGVGGRDLFVRIRTRLDVDDALDRLQAES